jgi:hypothetical protein
MDNASVVTVYHTADVQTAGGFTAGVGADGASPSKGRLVQRHLGLKDPSSTRRTKCPIATQALLAGYNVGTFFPYGGITWLITSTTGEKDRSRA